MTEQSLQNYVEEHIPIVKSLNFSIDKIEEDRLVCSALFQEHINHRNSVFGGSISSLLILTAWGRMKCLMESIDPGAIIVIQDSNVEYLQAVLSDFEAVCHTEDSDLKKFTSMYKRFGKARLELKVKLNEIGHSETKAQFKGRFVVVKPSEN